MQGNTDRNDWADRQERHLALVDSLLDEVRAYAMFFADEAELTRDERPIRTEVDLEFTYRRRTTIWMNVAIAWIPLSGRFEASIASDQDFVIVPVELPTTLGDVFDAMFAIVERAAEQG